MKIIQVDRALAERGQHLGLVGMGDDESGARLDDMKDQVEVSIHALQCSFRLGSALCRHRPLS